MAQQDDLSGLRWRWGEAYEITVTNGMFRAVRRDDGSVVNTTTAERLEAEICTDYHVRPVHSMGNDQGNLGSTLITKLASPQAGGHPSG